MTQVIQFVFADGFQTIVPASSAVRLRNAEHYGVQQWSADFLAAGQFPSAPPFTEWLFVETTGVEHYCRDMTATRGEMKPAAEVLPVPEKQRSALLEQLDALAAHARDETPRDDTALLAVPPDTPKEVVKRDPKAKPKRRVAA